MGTLVKVFIFVFSFSAYANCNKNAVLCQIKRNKPNIDHAYASRLSALINRASKAYRLEPKLLAAIFMQESSYSLQAKNCRTIREKVKVSLHDAIFNFESTGDLVTKYANNHAITRNNKKCFDFGIGQINIKTIEAYNFNVDLLLSDVEYSVFAAAKVLSDFKRSYAKHEDEWWTRYNASSPDKRDIYRSYVVNYL